MNLKYLTRSILRRLAYHYLESSQDEISALDISRYRSIIAVAEGMRVLLNTLELLEQTINEFGPLEARQIIAGTGYREFAKNVRELDLVHLYFGLIEQVDIISRPGPDNGHEVLSYIYRIRTADGFVTTVASDSEFFVGDGIEIFARRIKDV